MRRAVEAWSAKSPSATEQLFFRSADPIAAPARRGPHQPNRKIEKARSAKFEFSRKLRKRKSKGLETLDFANVALRFTRMRVAFDERLECSRSLIATCPWLPGYEHTKASVSPMKRRHLLAYE